MQSRIDIGTLFESQRQREQGKLRVQEAILERIHNRIRAASRVHGGVAHIWQTIPEFLVGLPRQTMKEAIVYVMMALMRNGFEVKYTHPHLLFINWEHHRDRQANDLNRTFDDAAAEIRAIQDREMAEVDSRRGIDRGGGGGGGGGGNTKQVRFAGVPVEVNKTEGVDVNRIRQPEQVEKAFINKSEELSTDKESLRRDGNRRQKQDSKLGNLDASFWSL